MKLIRIVIALLMAIHGIARITLGIVDDFGVFLETVGFPFGVVLAWTITLFELIGCALLLLNYQVKYVCAWFIIQLLTGVLLVHFQEGWFVVGAGRNGVEYSVLLIACFAALGWDKMRGNNAG